MVGGVVCVVAPLVTGRRWPSYDIPGTRHGVPGNVECRARYLPVLESSRYNTYVVGAGTFVFVTQHVTLDTAKVTVRLVLSTLDSRHMYSGQRTSDTTRTVVCNYSINSRSALSV